MTHKRKISVTGLGYVGLTIATAFGQTQKVIGYDKSQVRIAELKAGHDSNGEVDDEILRKADIHYTSDPDDLKKADFHIVAVLTPVTKDNLPDFSILLTVSETIGKRLKKGDIVVYESTVYPGATEEKCIPALEKASNLICGKDFFVGYSPERINPADKEHIFANITKVISAVNKTTLDIMSDLYSSVIKAGVYPVSTIRIAEATKVIENTQRDINISLMNEVALILHSIGMDTSEVLGAIRTKWNSLPFQPGFVGGHCIGVNSYYLAHKAEEAGFHPDVIHAGRRVNDYMPKFIADKTIKKLIHLGVPIKKSKIAVLGITYKENCPDLHNSRVLNLISELKSYDTEVLVYDPLADADAAKNAHIQLQKREAIVNCDAIILAVAHKPFYLFSKSEIKKMLQPRGLIMDVKRILNPEEFIDTELTLWRL